MIESYKKELKEYYEKQKEGDQISSLLNPTPASLRDLFMYRMEESGITSDIDIFERFIGFSYEKNAVNKIKSEIDKFRPLVNFLKGKSDLSEIKRLDALAIILNYPNRPFKKFSRFKSEVKEAVEEKDDAVLEESNNQISNLIEIFSENDKISDPERTRITDVADKRINIVETAINTQEVINVTEEASIQKQKKIPLKKIGIIGIVVVIIGISLFLNIRNWTAKECMVWKGDKYEAVDCSETINSFTETTLPKDDKLIEEFRKMKVDTKTSFFDKKGKPKIWYIKNPNGTLEFYNKPGLQPETGKTLKPISRYIIQEYVLTQNK